MIVEYIFLIATFFPYLRFFDVGTNSDIQCYSLIIAIVLIIYELLKVKKINKRILIFQVYILSLLLIIFSIFEVKDRTKDILFLLRGINGYVSLAFIPLASYFSIYRLKESMIEKFIKKVYVVWISVGVFQLINKTFLTGWRIRKVITSERGSISLANEPAYFCFALIIITLILLILDYNKNKIYMYITFLSTILIAKNSVGCLYSIILIVLFSIKKNNIKKILCMCIFTSMCFGILIFFVHLKKETRLAMLILNLLNSPKRLLFMDISLNIRFAHLFLSLKAVVKDFFIPHGVTKWKEYYVYEVLKNPHLFIEPVNRLQNSTGRIITMHGRLLYELGILSIPIYKFILNNLRVIKNGKKIFLFIMILGLNGVTIANPMFCFLIGFIIFKGARCDKNEEKFIFV